MTSVYCVSKLAPTGTSRQHRFSISMVPALLFVAALVSPLVSRMGHGLVLVWPAYLVWLFFKFNANQKLLWKVKQEIFRRGFTLLMFACWLIFIAVNYLLGRGYAGQTQIRVIITIGMITFMEITYTVQGGKAWRTLGTIIFIFLGLEVIWSLPTLWSQPMLARDIMESSVYSNLNTQAALKGVGEYGFYTGCAIAFPFLVAWALERKRILRFLLLAVCGAIAIAIVLANFTGAVVLLVTGICFLGSFALWKGHKKIRSLIFFIFIGLFAFGTWSLFLKTSTQGEFLINRISSEVSGVLARGLIEGDTTNRAIYWKMSLNTFLDNPLVGVGPVSGQENPFTGTLVGVHSSWLDALAEYGLIGFGFYVAFLLGSMKRVFMAVKTGQRDLLSLARLVSCLLFIIGGTYNPVTFVFSINTFIFLLVMGEIPATATRPAKKSVPLTT